MRRELEIRKDEIWKPWPWRWWLGLDLKREGLWGGHGSWSERERERKALNLVCVWIGWDRMGLFNIIFVLFIFSIWGYPELEEHEFMFCSEFFVFFPKKRKNFFDNFLGFKIFRFKIHSNLNPYNFLFLILFLIFLFN